MLTFKEIFESIKDKTSLSLHEYVFIRGIVVPRHQVPGSILLVSSDIGLCEFIRAVEPLKAIVNEAGAKPPYSVIYGEKGSAAAVMQSQWVNLREGGAVIVYDPSARLVMPPFGTFETVNSDEGLMFAILKKNAGAYRSGEYRGPILRRTIDNPFPAYDPTLDPNNRAVVKLADYAPIVVEDVEPAKSLTYPAVDCKKPKTATHRTRSQRPL
jgi:hypothetical protein